MTVRRDHLEEDTAELVDRVMAALDAPAPAVPEQAPAGPPSS